VSVLDNIDLTPFRQAFVLANTPMFLFKQFRKVALARQLGETYSADELVDAFNEHANRIGPSEEEDTIRAYVALIALGFASFGDAKRASERLRMKRLPWAATILSAALAGPVTTAVQSIQISAPRPTIRGGASVETTLPDRLVLKSAAEQVASNTSPLIISVRK